MITGFFTNIIMMSRIKWFVARVTPLFLGALMPAVASASELDQLVSKAFSIATVTSVLLTDEDVVKLGVLDFNPNELVNLDTDQLGSEESRERRSNLRSISLPMRFELKNDDDHNYAFIGAKAAWLKQTQELTFAGQPDAQADKFQEKTSILGMGGGYSQMLTSHWQLDLGGYLNWLHYRNYVDYNSDVSRVLAPFLDGLISNVSFDMWMAEPIVSLRYHLDWNQAHLELFSTTHYLTGSSFNEAMSIHNIEPEAWYSSNGILVKRPFAGQSLQGHSLWYRLAQVNVGADLREGLGTTKYYEAGVAWLVATPGISSWLDNVGLGINLNYGSDLRGGTLIILFNK